jgi:dipeptidyl aminopeptidase/acylaminoacyl peptidase
MQRGGPTPPLCRCEVQGENDNRVTRGQAQQVTDAIKGKGDVAEVVYHPAE